jgi:hypothetical protein
VTAKQKTRSKYVMALTDEERGRLGALIQNGKHRARQLLKARILLKADASDPGRGGTTARSRRLWTPASTRSTEFYRTGSATCSSARSAAPRTKCVGSMPISPTTREAGPARAE